MRRETTNSAVIERKKQIELRYLKKFLANKELQFEIKSIENSETPDFIVSTGDRTISIELTKLVVSNLKFFEEFRNSVIAAAHKTFRDRHGKNLHCLIGMRNVKLGETRSDRLNQIKKYSEKLLKRIEKIYLDNSDTEFDITIEHINDFDDLVTRLHINTNDNFDHWQFIGAHRVDWVDMDWLTKRIKEKEMKISNYRQRFDENWLLLVSNTGTKPSAHRFDFLDFSQIETQFEKVFVYKSIEDKIIKIV